MSGLDPLTVISVGASVANIGLLGGIFYRLGLLVGRVEDHHRRLSTLEDME